MAKATYVHDGRSLDYTPSSDVSAGDVVVLGGLIGVAKIDIAANKLGALAVEGVFDFAKGAEVIALWSNCYWDTENQVATTTVGTNAVLGTCVKAAAEGDATVRIRLA